MTLRQLDIKTAFLYADVEEEIYVYPPASVDTPDSSVKWCWKLKKALYGIKQAPRDWNDTITSFLIMTLGFAQCYSESCLFFYSSGATFILLWLYVDDMIFAHNDDAAMGVDCTTAFKRVQFGR